MVVFFEGNPRIGGAMGRGCRSRLKAALRSSATVPGAGSIVLAVSS